MHKYNLNYIASTTIKKEIESGEKAVRENKRSLSYGCYSNATVLPSTDYDDKGIIYGGVCNKNGAYIEESAYVERRSFGYTVDDNEVISSHEHVIYIGFFLNCYGHGITDNIKKLWFLKSDTYKVRFSDYSIVYITERNEPLPKWQKEIFSLAGFDSEGWIQIVKPTKFEKVIIPDNSLQCANEHRTFTLQYTEIIDCIKRNCTDENMHYDKIYFTRTGINNYWRECGEERVESYFKRHGYTVISPEKHSVKEQISMMMNCKSFASTEGSCAHNSVFCKQGTEVILLRKADYANAYQIMINEFAKLNVTYIDVHKSVRTDKLQPWHGPFFIYVSPFLRKYFHELPIDTYLFDPLYWIYRYCKWSWYNKLFKFYRNKT